MTETIQVWVTLEGRMGGTPFRPENVGEIDEREAAIFGAGRKRRSLSNEKSLPACLGSDHDVGNADDRRPTTAQRAQGYFELADRNFLSALTDHWENQSWLRLLPCHPVYQNEVCPSSKAPTSRSER